MEQYLAVCVLTCLMCGVIVISTFGTQECESTIERYVDYTVIVCCSVTCKSDYFVDVCKVNGTADRCVPCPNGTYLDSSTDSKDPEKCIKIECLPESIPASTFPKDYPQCRRKCVCDVQRQFVGLDPCACSRATVTCTHEQSLTIYNTCEPIEKEVTITTSSPSSMGYFMTTQEGNPEDRILTDETRVNSNVTVPSYNPGPEEDNNLVTIIVSLLVIMFVVMSVATAMGVYWYKKRKESSREINGETGTNEEPENISLMPFHTTHPTRMEYNASSIVENGSVNDQNGKTNTDEELENISFESLSTHPTITDSINASHCFGIGSVNSYYNSGKFTGMDANKNCQFGTTSSSADEEMKSSSLMPPNTHSTKTAGNASYIMGNGPVDNERIDSGRDAKENYQFDSYSMVYLDKARSLSLRSFDKDEESVSYALRSVEPLSKPE